MLDVVVILLFRSECSRRPERLAQRANARPPTATISKIAEPLTRKNSSAKAEQVEYPRAQTRDRVGGLTGDGGVK